MAETPDTPRFGQASPVYAVSASASPIDFRNCIDMRLDHLDAALSSGFEAIRGMDELRQDNYLRMLHGMVCEVRDLMSAMDAATEEASHE